MFWTRSASKAAWWSSPACSGLGATVAVAVAQAGADVVIGAGRDAGGDRDRVEGIGRKALVVPTDVSVVEDCSSCIPHTGAAFGRLDGLVNNAGVATAVPALQESPEQFRAVIDLNLMGAYWTAQAAARAIAWVVRLSTCRASLG